MYQFQKCLLLVHSESLITYFWKVDINNLKWMNYQNRIWLVNNNFHRTIRHCNCDNNQMLLQVNNVSMSSITISLN